MNRYLIVCLTFFCPCTAAQSVSTLIGARSAGTGNLSSVLSDASALFNNIGGLSGVTDKSAFFSYEAQTQMPGANRTACALLLPFRSSTAGVGFFRFGDDVYNEQLGSLGWSQKLGSTSLGARVTYIQYQAQGFGTKTGASVSLGGLTQITKQIFIGAYIVNLPIKNPTDEEQLPSILVAGIGFKPGNIFLGTEVEKNLRFGATWRMGAEYTVQEKVFFRTGFNLNPNAGFFGIGAKVKSLKADYAIKLSMTLGAAHQATCTYSFEKQRKPK